jgi:hypothetical protein
MLSSCLFVRWLFALAPRARCRLQRMSLPTDGVRLGTDRRAFCCRFPEFVGLCLKGSKLTC